LAFSVRFHREAASYIKKLDSPTKKRVQEKLKDIQSDPLNIAFSKPLKASTERSARIGDYRILFEVDASTETIFVVAMGPRGDIYKD
jgi:mRNA interferase RelE/StbE